MAKDNDNKNDIMFKSMISNKLLEARTILIFGEINQKVAK